jgi:GNAT superfamily N-acetyltransferase
MYRIRAVDGFDDEAAEAIHSLHADTFLGLAPAVDPENGYWWLAYYEDDPIGFAGLIPSTYEPRYGYFSRVGVLNAHRGNGLQRRMMRAVEARAKQHGWKGIISDTTDNFASANNFIRCGYVTFAPKYPWSFKTAIYWRKDF